MSHSGAERQEGSDPTAESVRAYYDNFNEARGETYLCEGNLRIAKAIERTLPYVSPESCVLEIGCGIGLVAEQIARRATRGHVYASDISDKSVISARQRVAMTNLDFRAVDAVDRFDELRKWLAKLVDLVVLVDVIEHVPQKKRGTLMSNLRSVLSLEATMVLTYPSPTYQRYLREHNPAKLQIIDEIVEIDHIVDLATSNGLYVKHFSLEDVWLKNQYAHCVLKTSVALGKTDETERVHQGLREIDDLVAAMPFILVDEDQWRHSATAPLRPLPFLERAGEYWGLPADDQNAIQELERLRCGGAGFIVFAAPAFWWLDHYTGFARHLAANFPRVLNSENVIAFKLHQNL